MIRKMTPADLDAVMAIWLAGNLEAHPFIPASYWHAHFPAVRSAIQQATVYCAIADQDKVVGFIGLTGNYIAGLFVAKDFRQHGIGQQLLAVAKNSKNSLTLDAYVQNQHAINFYRHQGFVITQQTADEVRMSWSAKK